MKLLRILSIALLALTLTMALCPAALAADLGSAATTAQVCYPTSINRSEDGTELKKIYDLGPEDDPLGMGMVGGKAADGISRQPEMESKIRTTLMLDLVFIETAIIYALLVVILVIFVL